MSISHKMEETEQGNDGMTGLNLYLSVIAQPKIGGIHSPDDLTWRVKNWSYSRKKSEPTHQRGHTISSPLISSTFLAITGR